MIIKVGYERQHGNLVRMYKESSKNLVERCTKIYSSVLYYASIL